MVIAGFCGSADNVQYTKTDEVKISTGQLPSGFYPAIYEKLLFAIVYIILVPIWRFFMREALAKPYYKLVLALILCCCAGCVCSFVSLLLSNQSGRLRSPIILILDALVILLRSVGSCIVLLLACGFALSLLFIAQSRRHSLGADRFHGPWMHLLLRDLRDRRCALSASASLPSAQSVCPDLRNSHVPVAFSSFHHRNRLACVYLGLLIMATNKSVDFLNDKSQFKESSLFRRYRSFSIVWLILSIILSVWYASLLFNTFVISLSLHWMFAL